MNLLIYILIASVFLLDFLGLKLGTLPRFATWLPEILSLAAILIVAMEFTMSRNKAMSEKYWLFIILFLVHILIGIVLNTVPAGALVTGFRTYLKFMPFFLLPLLYRFSDQQIRNQLRLVLFFLLLQMPVAVYQRLFQYKGALTGDVVTGTVSGSGMLTGLMVCGIAVTLAFYLKQRIKLLTMLIIVAALFIPTAINETKISLVLLPLAFLFPFLLSSGAKGRLKKLIPLAVIGVVGMVAFVGIYDHFVKARWGYGIVEFLTMEGRVEGYMSKGAKAGQVGGQVGRLDTYTLAVEVLSDDAIKLGFGLGIGNVSGSFLSGFSGEYAQQYARYGVGVTGFAYFLWEIGVVGVLLYLLFFYLVFSDARRLGKSEGSHGALGVGWAAVVMLMVILVSYANVFIENAIGYLFWYFSGLVAASRFRMDKEARLQAAAVPVETPKRQVASHVYK